MNVSYVILKELRKMDKHAVIGDCWAWDNVPWAAHLSSNSLADCLSKINLVSRDYLSVHVDSIGDFHVSVTAIRKLLTLSKLRFSSECMVIGMRRALDSRNSNNNFLVCSHFNIKSKNFPLLQKLCSLVI